MYSRPYTSYDNYAKMTKIYFSENGLDARDSSNKGF